MAQTPGISTANCNASETDLIALVCAEFIYPCGSVHARVSTLKSATDRASLAAHAHAYNLRIRSWSPEKNISAAIEAFHVATLRVGKSSHSPAPCSPGSQNAAAAPQKFPK